MQKIQNSSVETLYEFHHSQRTSTISSSCSSALRGGHETVRPHRNRGTEQATMWDSQVRNHKAIVNDTKLQKSVPYADNGLADDLDKHPTAAAVKIHNFARNPQFRCSVVTATRGEEKSTTWSYAYRSARITNPPLRAREGKIRVDSLCCFFSKFSKLDYVIDNHTFMLTTTVVLCTQEAFVAIP